jgi:hypothetical protein
MELLGRAARLIAAPVEVDTAARDIAIGRALDAAPQNVVPLRRRRVAPIVGGLVAAAIVGLVAIPLATRSDSGSDLAQSTTTALDSAAAPAAGAARKAAPESGSMAVLAAPAPGPGLGELADGDLRDRLADEPRSPEGPPVTCEAEARAGRAGDATRTFTGHGTWHGDDAVVIVLRYGSVEYASVLTTATCTVETSIQL